MKYIPLAGRVLFSLHFIMGAVFHFMPTSVQMAAAAGVPVAKLLVPLSGLMALGGGVFVLVGYKAKIAGWVLVAFLIPVNFIMHQFWTITDPMQQQMMMTFFLKDLSMTGAALLIAYFGAGPISFDNRK